LRGWSDVLIARDNASEEVIEAAASELRAYLKWNIENCAASSDATLLSSLVRAREQASPPLTIEEITTLAFTLVLAGYETTACVLGSSVYLLLSPDKSLEDNPMASARLAVEECLRYIPLGGGVGRTRIAAADLEVGGVKIERGEAVFICGHAVNRDPRVFDAPETVDLNRRVNPHQTFGNGPHRCLGASLARLELVAAMEALFESFPRLRLQLGSDAVSWRQGRLMRGPDQLRVTW
jgi:cytochrome P450